jgi:hypothetical protein
MFKNLEKAILRFRTNEMMRLLFHVEDLRKFLVNSMTASNLFLDESDDRVFNKNTKVMPQVWKRLNDDKILTKSEVDDLKKIIGKRNTIAHEVHNFTRDLHYELKEYTKKQNFQSQYDYGALVRLLKYKSRIQSQWCGISVLSFRYLHFEFADKLYKEENTKLLKRIDRLYEQRGRLVDSVNQELTKVNFDSYEEHPKNEGNYKADGSLSLRGGKACRDLLSKKFSCPAVSILMGISLDKVKYHKRKLEKNT